MTVGCENDGVVTAGPFTGWNANHAASRWLPSLPKTLARRSRGRASPPSTGSTPPAAVPPCYRLFSRRKWPFDGGSSGPPTSRAFAFRVFAVSILPIAPIMGTAPNCTAVWPGRARAENLPVIRKPGRFRSEDGSLFRRTALAQPVAPSRSDRQAEHWRSQWHPAAGSTQQVVSYTTCKGWQRCLSPSENRIPSVLPRSSGGPC